MQQSTQSPSTKSSIQQSSIIIQGNNDIISFINVTTIDTNLSVNWDLIHYLIITPNITLISKSVFKLAKFIVSVTVDQNNLSFKSINDVLFSYDLSILIFYPPGKPNKRYAIPDNVKTIKSFAFSNSYNLEEIIIPRTVDTIEESAFYQCSKLEIVSVAPNNPSYSSGNGILYSKNKDTLIYYPPNKKSISFIAYPQTKNIANNAYQNCTSLLNLVLLKTTITDLNTSIQIDNLRSISLPSTVKTIQLDIFKDNKQLESITVDPKNQYFISISGILFSKNGGSLIIFPPKNRTAYLKFPPGIEEIPPNTFRSAECLKQVIIADSVKRIGHYAFSMCKCLEEISIPKSVIIIDHCAFNCCSKLHTIVIPPFVTALPSDILNQCQELKSITIQCLIPNPMHFIQNLHLPNNTEITILSPNSI